MPRKKLIRSDAIPYHVCNRVLDHKFYGPELEDIWQVYCGALCIVSWAYGAKVHSFVLMSNHYHLLISTPEKNLDEIMCFFQSHISREVAKMLRSSAYCFDTRYRWTLLSTPSHLNNVYRYIYQNPLRAGLVPRCEDYPFSSLAGLLGERRLEFPCVDSPLFGQDFLAWDVESFLSWLNQRPHPKVATIFQKALKHREFFLTERNQALVEKELGAF